MTTTKLSIDIKEFLEKTTTKTFLFAARQFVDLLEMSDVDKNIFYPKAHRLLLELYLSGYNLDAIVLKYSTNKKELTGIDELFEDKNAGLISELGKETFYWEAFDPTYFEQGEEPNSEFTIKDGIVSQGWLVDDFEDIYKDIKKEILKIDNVGTDETIEDALWQLRWGFIHHWGQHCINALRYLHYLQYDGKKTY